MLTVPGVYYFTCQVRTALYTAVYRDRQLQTSVLAHIPQPENSDLATGGHVHLCHKHQYGSLLQSHEVLFHIGL